MKRPFFLNGTAFVAAAGLLCVMVSFTEAKTNWKEKGFEGASVIAGGFRTFNLDELNNDLEDNGIEAFPEIAPTLSFSKYLYLNRLVTTTDLDLMFWEGLADGGMETTLFGVSLMSHAGVNLLRPEMPVNVYPFGGLGWGAARLSHRESRRSFADALGQEAYDVAMWQHTFLIDIGAGVEYVFSFGMKEKKMIVGLRGGYRFDVLDQDTWNELSGTTLTGAPDPRMSGAFVDLVIGGFRSYEDKDNEREY
jgi:hypothetical protein